MSKKNKKQKNYVPEKEEAGVTDRVLLEDEVVFEPEIQEPILTIQEAARRFIPNYKDHHLPGIVKFSQTKNFASGTEEECKNILRQWGAKI